MNDMRKLMETMNLLEEGNGLLQEMAKLAANRMVAAFHSDQELQNKVMQSFEPYRALAWEFDLQEIDGTHLWSYIMDEMDGRL